MITIHDSVWYKWRLFLPRNMKNLFGLFAPFLIPMEIFRKIYINVSFDLFVKLEVRSRLQRSAMARSEKIAKRWMRMMYWPLTVLDSAICTPHWYTLSNKLRRWVENNNQRNHLLKQIIRFIYLLFATEEMQTKFSDNRSMSAADVFLGVPEILRTVVTREIATTTTNIINCLKIEHKIYRTIKRDFSKKKKNTFFTN